MVSFSRSSLVTLSGLVGRPIAIHKYRTKLLLMPFISNS
jgi:hypothetical protein